MIYHGRIIILKSGKMHFLYFYKYLCAEKKIMNLFQKLQKKKTNSWSNSIKYYNAFTYYIKNDYNESWEQ